MTVADLIVDRLRSAGVAALFGVPGGGSNLDVIESAQQAGLPFVLTATETAGAIAALAQAEISGRPGACLTTLGPGVASVVNGVACAWLERTALIVITDSHPRDARGVFAHQQLDHRALLAPVTKWSATMTPGEAATQIDQAIACAMAPPSGPVHLDCAADVALQQAHGSETDGRGADAERLAKGGTYDAAELDRLVTRARKPLLLVGLGARHPGDAAAIRRCCECHHIPAMVTYKAKGVVPDTDPHFAGVFTNGSNELPVIQEADMLVAVGLDPIELIPRRWRHPQPIVYCGRWPVARQHVPFCAQIIDEVPSGLRELDVRLGPSAWNLDDVARLVSGQRNAMRPWSHSMPTHEVVGRVAEIASASARVTVDAGAHMFPITVLWPVHAPNRMLISNGLSTMGFALPAAIGAAILDRTTPVVALTGDGGLLMCAGELLTAVREHLRIVTVVFNDASLSLIDIKQRQRRFAAVGVSLGAVEWASIAEGVGMVAYVAAKPGEVTEAIERALECSGPSLIDVRVNPSTYADTLRAARG